MYTTQQVSLYDIAISLANGVDLVSPEVEAHHRRVAYLATRLAEAIGLPAEEQTKVATAALLHDIGALSVKERLSLLEFEADMTDGSVQNHAQRGYVLLRDSVLLGHIAPLIRDHHKQWAQRVAASSFDDDQFLANIIFLADRVEVLTRTGGPLLAAVPAISKRIAETSGTWFAPDLVDAMNELGRSESFWLDMVYDRDAAIPIGGQLTRSYRLGIEELVSLSETFCRLIDFRSHFTATHSSGVAAVAARLAHHLGLTPSECRLMAVAGNLHDIGKLAVPPEILDKDGPLTEEERAIMRAHTYQTFRILDAIPGLEIVKQWASFHHERLQGDGYPFRHTEADLSLGARALAVADVFTAITEDRPYRKGMTEKKALAALQSMVKQGTLDARCVTVLAEHVGNINEARRNAQREARSQYAAFKKAG